MKNRAINKHANTPLMMEQIIKTRLIISIADKNNGLPESATAEMIIKITRHNTVNTARSRPT
jgi:hypothetical protein